MPRELKRCGSCKQLLPVYGKFWQFTLSLEPPSQNTVSGNKGSGRHKYKKLRDDYEFLFIVFRNELKIPKATGRRRVYITRLYSGRGQPRDRGNIIGGCKPLLDAMTRAKLIVDDKGEFLEDHYDQRRAKEKGVEIYIEEME